MSLQVLAQGLQARGRGKDSILVHMTPNEVNSLQGLAAANGGELTINPETGLPEAGILDTLLPMVAGFALGPAGANIMSTMMAGLSVGAATGLITGDLGKGLSAGLGAYGGSSIGSAWNPLKNDMTRASTFAAPWEQAKAVEATKALTPESLVDRAGATPNLGVAQVPPPPNVQVPRAHGLASEAFGNRGPSLATAQNANQAHLASRGNVAPVAPPPAKDNKGISPWLLGGAGVLGLGAMGAFDQEQMALAPQDASAYGGPYKPAPRFTNFTHDPYTDSSEGTYFVDELGNKAINPYPSTVQAAGGGLMGYADGGEAGLGALPSGLVELQDGSFVVDARTVAEIGNGNTRAGENILVQRGGEPVGGDGDGVADDVPATIEGEQDALVSDGEVIFDPQDVERMGGAEVLYKLVADAHAARKETPRGKDSGLGAAMGYADSGEVRYPVSGPERKELQEKAEAEQRAIEKYFREHPVTEEELRGVREGLPPMREGR